MGKGKGGAGKAELQHLLSESDNARKTAASPDRSPTIIRYGLGTLCLALNPPSRTPTACACKSGWPFARCNGPCQSSRG